jgi:flagellar hook assembly protein FlgD
VIKRTALLQSYPNPFNPEVWIPYDLAEESPVSIHIYNISGQLIRTLDLGMQPRGRYTSKEKASYWDGLTQAGEQAASGVYFYVLRAGRFTAAKKMVILK